MSLEKISVNVLIFIPIYICIYLKKITLLYIIIKEISLTFELCKTFSTLLSEYEK